MSRPAFEYFVILADMRTGSNLLEDQLALYEGVEVHGELFNPHFVGRPKNRDVLGFDLRKRDSDPLAFLNAVRANARGIPGFRLFRDHEPRILDHTLSDEACAKIVLTRKPVDSFLSLQIARKTGQWWLGNVKQAKTAKVRFEPDEFADYADALAQYHSDIRQRLQFIGQAAFYVDYPEVRDRKVIDGIVRFLGKDSVQRAKNGRQGRPQNPVPMAEKVSNPRVLEKALKERDPSDMDETPDLEPRKTSGVRGFLACSSLALLHVSLKTPTAGAVTAWLEEQELAKGGHSFRISNQKELRKWMRTTPDFESVAIIEHPVERAYSAYTHHLLRPETLNCDLKVVVERDFGWEQNNLEAGFLAFLQFLEQNLQARTTLAVDPSWATQATRLQAVCSVVLPRRILSKKDASTALAEMAGVATGPDLNPAADLKAVYSNSIEALARKVYRRDYLMFGFSDFA